MVCIQCGQQTHVSNSRLQKRNNQVWRRRRCEACGAVFSTLEAPNYAAAWLVKAPSSRPVPFLRDKLFLSLYSSCQHRPMAMQDAADLTDTVMRDLARLVSDSLIPAEQIKSAAQAVLDRFDQAAGVHYRAFHGQ